MAEKRARNNAVRVKPVGHEQVLSILTNPAGSYSCVYEGKPGLSHPRSALTRIAPLSTFPFDPPLQIPISYRQRSRLSQLFWLRYGCTRRYAKSYLPLDRHAGVAFPEPSSQFASPRQNPHWELVVVVRCFQKFSFLGGVTTPVLASALHPINPNIHNFFLCFCPLLFHTFDPKGTTSFFPPTLLLPHHASSELFTTRIGQARYPFTRRLLTQSTFLGALCLWAAPILKPLCLLSFPNPSFGHHGPKPYDRIDNRGPFDFAASTSDSLLTDPTRACAPTPPAGFCHLPSGVRGGC